MSLVSLVALVLALVAVPFAVLDLRVATACLAGAGALAGIALIRGEGVWTARGALRLVLVGSLLAGWELWELRRPTPAATPALPIAQPGGQNREVVLPLIVERAPITRLALLEFATDADPVYVGLEPQLIERGGKRGVRIVAYRHDGRVDVYDDLPLSPEPDDRSRVTGGGRLHYRHTDLGDPVLEVDRQGRVRIEFAFLDAEGRYEIGQEVLPVDALKFKDSRKYPERLKEALENSGETDALVVMGGAVHSISVVAAAFEFDFMGGSMGSVVGERFVRGVETAIEQKVPFICFTATGGARMQEGLLSLMQMAKTNASLTRLAKKGLPYISVLTDPTMGGVSAGFAFVGDVVIAEPKALIGFAGPRVIENTVRVKLPDGFQRAEFLQTKGAVDFICDRRELREKIAKVLAMLQRQPADAVQ